jgi:hypothetical protein
MGIRGDGMGGGPLMLVINFEALNDVTKRGVVAFTRTENFKALRSELLEMALAIDEILEKGETDARLEAAALEGGDVVVMLARFKALCGHDLWVQGQEVTVAKARRKVEDREAEHRESKLCEASLVGLRARPARALE